MNKFDMVKVYCSFDDVYGWGVGYYPGMYEKWKRFFSNDFRKKYFHWNFIEGENSSSDTLYGLGAAICFHPLDFNFIGGEYTNIEELVKICTDLCNELGVTFDMQVKYYFECIDGSYERIGIKDFTNRK